MSLEDIDNLNELNVENGSSGHIEDTKKIMRGMKSLKTELSGKFDDSRVPYISVDDLRNQNDVDDTLSFQRAINLAKTYGIKRIIARKSLYTCSSSVDYGGLNNCTIEGVGMTATVLEISGATGILNAFFLNTSAVSNVTFRKMMAKGTAVDDVTGPRRSRTFTGNGFNTFITATGDLSPQAVLTAATSVGATTFTSEKKLNPSTYNLSGESITIVSSTGSTAPYTNTVSSPMILVHAKGDPITFTYVARNVRLEQIKVQGSRGLPWWFQGVRGYAKASNCETENTMDAGWTYCEKAWCVDNASFKGADNGFSLSRGCHSVIAVGNRVDGAAYFGMWCSGFVQSGEAVDKGPRKFIVSGNNITNVGKGGIQADDAPKYGTIFGNVVDTVLRGPSDAPSDLFSVGIYVGGFPVDDRQNPTDYAEHINIFGNTLIDCARGGILLAGAKSITVTGNHIVRPGSQYLADGSTVIASNDLANNFGISVLLGAQATVTGLTMTSNTIIDDRTTPYANYAWYTSGSINPYVSDNREIGTRQSANLVHDSGSGINHSGVHIWQLNQKYTAGATSGASTATGTVAGFDINGAAGSNRILNQILTGTSRRWLVRGSGDAESGSNVGTRYQIDAYSDAGVLIKSMLTLTRDGKIGFNGAAPTMPTLPAAATDLATAITLVNSIRSALIALGLAV